MQVSLIVKKLGGWAEKSNEEKVQRKWIRELSSSIGWAESMLDPPIYCFLE
jgi:hypothetical protein